MEAMHKGVIEPSIDDFYYLARTSLVKDESHYDKFDRAFGEYFKGVEHLMGAEADIPLEWLLKQAELNLSPEEKALIESLGGWEKLMAELRKRLEEQKGRHQGGSKMIGTAGTSPFGAYGYNPEGIRIGQDKSRNRSAVKVWDQREYANYDTDVELGHAQHQGRAAAAAQVRARRRARGTRPRHHDRQDRAQRRAARPPHAPGAAQRGQGADVPRRRRLDGRSHQARAGALQRLEDRVQAPRVLLLPQLPVRLRVEGQPAPPRRAHAHRRPDAQVRPRLQGDLRRRRDHEPVRDPAAGRLDRVPQRGGRRGAGCVGCWTSTRRRCG